MSATRTQIYLTSEQREWIDRIARSRGVTMAEVVRAAVDRYLADTPDDPSAALSATFGADADVAVPSRDEWDRG